MDLAVVSFCRRETHWQLGTRFYLDSDKTRLLQFQERGGIFTTASTLDTCAFPSSDKWWPRYSTLGRMNSLRSNVIYPTYHYHIFLQMRKPRTLMAHTMFMSSLSSFLTKSLSSPHCKRVSHLHCYDPLFSGNR